MKSNTNLFENFSENKALNDAGTVDAEILAYYISKGRMMRSQAATKMMRLFFNGVKKTIAAAFHFATDWMVDMYRPSAH